MTLPLARLRGSLWSRMRAWWRSRRLHRYGWFKGVINDPPEKNPIIPVLDGPVLRPIPHRPGYFYQSRPESRVVHLTDFEDEEDEEDNEEDRAISALD